MPVSSPLRIKREEEEQARAAYDVWKLSRQRPIDEQIVLNPVLLARRAGIDPDPWQEEFLLSDAKRILLNCSRQSGKSTMAAIKAVHCALYEPKSLQIIMSPGIRQSGELFAKCRDIYESIGKPILAESESALQMRLQNGSRVVALPGNAGRIRGFSGARRIIIDEAAWVPEDLYRSIRPMLAVSGGDLIAMSTPFGRQGWWYDAWEDPLQEWKRIRVTALECPRISAEFLQEERIALPPEWFASEYMCEFTSASATVFDKEWWSNGQSRFVENDPANKGSIIARWLSFDTAMKDKDSSDYTSCTVGELTRDWRLQTRRVWRDRLRFPDLIARMESTWLEYSLDGKLREVIIEDRVSGTSAYQTLVSGTTNPELARRCVAYNPGQMSKRARASLAAVWCKNGCVELPHPGDTVGEWLSTFERELFGFTGTAQDEHDDMVDSFVQLVLYLEENDHIMSTGYYARIEAQKRRIEGADRGGLIRSRSARDGRR